MSHRRARADLKLAVDCATTAAELAIATPQVIAARLAMGAQSLSDPLGAGNAEAMLMVSEKAQAFAEAGVAASGRAAEMGARTAAYWMTEAASAGGSPAAAADRLFGYWTGMARLGLQMQSAAMAPLHRTATANARRLRA